MVLVVITECRQYATTQLSEYDQEYGSGAQWAQCPGCGANEVSGDNTLASGVTNNSFPVQTGHRCRHGPPLPLLLNDVPGSHFNCTRLAYFISYKIWINTILRNHGIGRLECC